MHGQKGPASASYALAVYLFAPLAIIVPLTVSSAVGAHTIVGERERGSGEFLAHSPATERQIYLGKLMASLIPGYFTAAMGFLLYSLVVNLIVGPKLGGWFFPTTNWWILMLWVLPPFIALALAVILAISARVSSAAAAQQASALATLPLIVIAYGVSSGTLFRGAGAAFVIGGLAWCGAIFALWRASKAVSRERLLGMGATCPIWRGIAHLAEPRRNRRVAACTRASRRCGSGWPMPSPTRRPSCRATVGSPTARSRTAPRAWPRALADLGVGHDTKVALFLHNCPEYMECLFALSKLRAVPANVNFRYLGDELVQLVDNADAEVLVYHRSLRDRVDGVRDRMPRVAPPHRAGRRRRRLRVRAAPARAPAGAAHRTLGRRPPPLVHRRHHRPAQGRALAPGHAARVRAHRRVRAAGRDAHRTRWTS